jgi:hypothetical protein
MRRGLFCKTENREKFYPILIDGLIVFRQIAISPFRPKRAGFLVIPEGPVYFPSAPKRPSMVANIDSEN